MSGPFGRVSSTTGRSRETKSGGHGTKATGRRLPHHVPGRDDRADLLHHRHRAHRIVPVRIGDAMNAKKNFAIYAEQLIDMLSDVAMNDQDFDAIAFQRY